MSTHALYVSQSKTHRIFMMSFLHTVTVYVTVVINILTPVVFENINTNVGGFVALVTLLEFWSLPLFSEHFIWWKVSSSFSMVNPLRSQLREWIKWQQGGLRKWWKFMVSVRTGLYIAIYHNWRSVQNIFDVLKLNAKCDIG